MGSNALETTKDLRRQLAPKDPVIPYIPGKLPVERYNLFNRIIGTVDWAKLNLQTFMDVTRTFYEAIYPFFDRVAGDNEFLLEDNFKLQRENGAMICYLKETNQWEKYQSYLKNTLSKKSEHSSTSSQESTIL